MKEKNSAFLNIFAKREVLLIIVIIIMAGVVSILTPYFLTSSNLLSMLMGLTVEGLVVIGMVLILISGGLDLSVGSVMAFTGVITGIFVKTGMPVFIAIILGILVSIGIGSINGILIAKAKMSSFITTLGMSMAIYGLMLVVSKGQGVQELPNSFALIGQGNIFGIQYPIIILAVFVIGFDIFIRNSAFIRQSYYVGGNEAAAKLNGINVARVKIIDYIICSAIAGIAGILVAARFGSASVTLGTNTAMYVITAAILGGASLNGGMGSVLGGFLGAMFMQVVATSLNLLGISMYWQDFVTGAILIVAIFLNSVNEARASGKNAL